MREHTAPKHQDEGRYRLRAGAAKVALDMKRTGHGKGEGFMAEQLAGGHSEKTLEKMGRGRTRTIIVV